MSCTAQTIGKRFFMCTLYSHTASTDTANQQTQLQILLCTSQDFAVDIDFGLIRHIHISRI